MSDKGLQTDRTPAPEPTITYYPEHERLEIVKEPCRYVFSVTERQDLANEMAEATVAKEALLDHRKTILAQVNHDLAMKEATLKSCAQKLTAGYEMRTIECRVERDYEDKMIRFYRLDTGEFVREKPMTTEELQRRLT